MKDNNKKLFGDRVKKKIRQLVSSVRESTKSLSRDSRWGKVRDEHLRRMPFCAACGSCEKLQVHHRIPVHLDRARELDPTNLVTLCMSEQECHLDIGHNGSWKDYNERLDEVLSALRAHD